MLGHSKPIAYSLKVDRYFKLKMAAKLDNFKTSHISRFI